MKIGSRLNEKEKLYKATLIVTNKHGPKTLKFEIPRLFNELKNNSELLNLEKIKEVKTEIKKFYLLY